MMQEATRPYALLLMVFQGKKELLLESAVIAAQDNDSRVVVPLSALDNQRKITAVLLLFRSYHYTDIRLGTWPSPELISSEGTPSSPQRCQFDRYLIIVKHVRVLCFECFCYHQVVRWYSFIGGLTFRPERLLRRRVPPNNLVVAEAFKA
ncbi:hypothetical protein Y032_0421g1167 [Ancylostoma ceylanicum]|uniref:Uncharacterized protein n=1 Tax=Ancylostoma ceylanicum TaxID=53326 RepID=A0A016X1B3_9BILA|nr:hypothetical protein Y032_0421g1167 [Ancylostoma ceylanicum]